jgi:hypothetical protein
MADDKKVLEVTDMKPVDKPDLSLDDLSGVAGGMAAQGGGAGSSKTYARSGGGWNQDADKDF